MNNLSYWRKLMIEISILYMAVVLNLRGINVNQINKPDSKLLHLRNFMQNFLFD